MLRSVEIDPFPLPFRCAVRLAGGGGVEVFSEMCGVGIGKVSKREDVFIPSNVSVQNI